MISVGIDIGGSKIETRAFDADWAEQARHRVETPQDYDALLTTIADEVQRIEERLGPVAALGIGAPGRIVPQTGALLTANLPAQDRPLVQDLSKTLGRPITFLNDSNAFTLSEGVFGAGRGASSVMAVILGTGVGGGWVIDGALRHGLSGLGGEIGHIAAPAYLVAAHNLPVFECGCGRRGCVETYLSGPGLERLAGHLTNQTISAPEIAARKNADMAEIWAIWCAFAGDLVHSLTLIADPDVIILGGGLSRVEGVEQDIAAAARAAQLEGFAVPPLKRAQGGDASGARGAAYAAWQAHTRQSHT